MNNKTKIHSGKDNISERANLLRICSVIIPLCFLSLFLSAVIISVGNDMYAFIKPEETVGVSFLESSTLWERTNILSKQGVVKNPFVFYLYVKSKNGEQKIISFSGTLDLNTNMSYREILKSF